MKTIHIRGYSPDDWLLKKINKDFLINDPLWHFVFWNNGWTHKAYLENEHLIIRVSDEEILDQIELYLTNNNMLFEIYEFPFPGGKYQLGLKRGGWEEKNLDLSLPILHVLSIAYMRFGKGKKMERFISHYFHIACNISQLNHAEETELAIKLAYWGMSVVKDWYIRRIK